jgi:hypothetical protein
VRQASRYGRGKYEYKSQGLRCDDGDDVAKPRAGDNDLQCATSELDRRMGRGLHPRHGDQGDDPQRDDTELGNQLLAEGSAMPADVFLTENSPAMSMVEQAGLLAPVGATTLAQVAPPYRPSTGRWIGIAARSTVFVYNKTKPVASALPHSLLDLADPVWKGRWTASPTGADFQAIVSSRPTRRLGR